MFDLFESIDDPNLKPREFAPGGFYFPNRVREQAESLWKAVDDVIRVAPLRRMKTPGGREMSIITSSCGPWGWVSDELGYRYSLHDPLTDLRWPEIPPVLKHAAMDVALQAGYAGFEPDACVINQYEPGSRLSLHQDKDERDKEAPIVSISLGLPAVFIFGGLQRSDPVQKLRLCHGDAVVWGGPSRMNFHGIETLKPGVHEHLGERRVNLTFRRAK